VAVGRLVRRIPRALGILLVLGLALRMLFMLAYRPALLGYPDTSVYLSGVTGDLFGDPLRVAGYPAFLRVLHVVSSDLSFTTLVQHAAGLGTAVLLYLAARRIGGPRWVALVPAAVVLLGGDQLFFEHALLSEALFGLLVAGALYCAVRVEEAWWWAGAAGALVGLATTVRLAGLVLAPLLVVWLLARRPRLVPPAAAAAATLVVVLGYLVAAHSETGVWSLAPNGAYNFYGRVAPFADCSEFTPPEGTRALCQRSRPFERPSTQWYIFAGGSPAVRHFGEPQVGKPTRAAVRHVGAFARAAAINQPLDLVEIAARDFWRYVAPGSFRPYSPSPSVADYRAKLVERRWIDRALQLAGGEYSTRGTLVKRGLFARLGDYERVTRIEGPVMAVLLLLALAAPLVCRGPLRRGALLLAGTALALLVVPVVTHEYDGRFGVPAYGPLAAAAALALAGAAARWWPGRSRSPAESTRSPSPGPPRTPP
jgi:hypothetical protein